MTCTMVTDPTGSKPSVNSLVDRSTPTSCQITLVTIPSSKRPPTETLMHSPDRGVSANSKSRDGPSAPQIQTRTLISLTPFQGHAAADVVNLACRRYYATANSEPSPA